MTELIQHDKYLPSRSLCRHTTACEEKGGEGKTKQQIPEGLSAGGQGQTLRNFDQEMRTYDKNIL